MEIFTDSDWFFYPDPDGQNVTDPNGSGFATLVLSFHVYTLKVKTIAHTQNEAKISLTFGVECYGKWGVII